MSSATAAPLAPTPSREARRTDLPPPRRLRSGLEAWLHAWVGRARRRPRLASQWLQAAGGIADAALVAQTWSEERLDAELAAHAAAWRRNAPEVHACRAAALAAIVEAARRTTGLAAHPVQVAAAGLLTGDTLVEMATGEGKTLVLGLAAVLAGWTGRPCQVVTANDYLAGRDARTLERFYSRCGLRVAAVTGGMPPNERRSAYAADVTYTTAKELIADFLRDRLLLGRWVRADRRALRALQEHRSDVAPDRVQRGLHVVLIDEADHILIDEAVTPLIISRPRRNALLVEACREVAAFARELERGRDYDIDPSAQAIDLRPATVARVVSQWQPAARILRNVRWRQELVRQSLVAREFFHRDKHYVVHEGKVVIVDEGTGRPQAQRSWRQGLHQLIEAKEGLPLTDPTETLASVSFQAFFRGVPRLAGVTGTAGENADEFWRVYGLPVLRLPTHRPCVRRVHLRRVCATAAERWHEVVDAVDQVHATGQPVLIGTRSVAASEHLSRLLTERGIAAAVLNARQLAREAEIVAAAGQRGHVTLATNLAGRGTDIRLAEGVAERGGLCVIATEQHAAARVDRQLAGRAARQGDPGEVRPWASLEDELAIRFLPALLRRALQPALARRWRGAAALARRLLRFAQWRAERLALRQRLDVIHRDRWLRESLGTEGS